MAQPGSLDPQFGSGGIVANDRWGARSIALTSGEEILVLTGSDGLLLWDSTEFPPVGYYHTVPWLQRYSVDGMLEPTFGNQGTVDLSAVFPGFGPDHVLVRSDDRIVLAGHAYWPGGGLTIAVAQLHANGIPDLSFGTNGTALLDPALASEVHMEGALIDGDGRLLCFGHQGGPHSDLALVRWLPDGSLDASFGTNGFVVRDAADDPTVGNDRIEAAALLPDGRVLLTGRCGSATAPRALFVARLLPDGAVDLAFGDQGYVIDDLNAPPWTTGTGLALRPDGSAWVTGIRTVPGPFAFMRRYLADGLLDQSFGTGGEVVGPLGFATQEVLDLLPLGDGGALWLAHDTGAVVGQFTTDGTLQTAFGDGGRTRVNTQERCMATDLLLYADGRALVAGSALDTAGAHHLQLFRTTAVSVGFTDRASTSGAIVEVHGSPWTLNSSVLVYVQQPGPCKLDVVDRLGRVVVHLLSARQLAYGPHRFDLSALGDLAPGPYAVRVLLNGDMHQVVLIR